MARILISLKLTLLRNGTIGLRLAGWVVGAVAVVATWAAAVLAEPEARTSVVTLAFAMWGVGAALGPVLMSGNGVLRPDYFALLPLSRRALGRGLLLTVFVSIAAAFVLAAFLSSVVPALRQDPSTLVVVLIGAPLTWVFAICASRLVYGLLGAAMRSRLGVEIAGLQFGLMFASMFTGWMIVQVTAESIPDLLRDGLPEGAITTVLDAFPTSWTVLGIDHAAAGRWGAAAGLLVALAAVDLVLVVLTVGLLTPRPDAPTRRRAGRPRSASLVAGGGLLPAGPLGAVVSKELRQWWRDPWRSLEVRSGVWTGIAIGSFALASGEYATIAGFAGLIVAAMLGLGGCNLYGQDGSAVWLNVVGERAGSVRDDVRGRQLAMILIFLPQALLISVIFVVLSQTYWAVPILAATIPVTLGAASGAAILVSAIGVSPGVDPRLRSGPNDATGNITVHVFIVMALMTVACLPTVAVIAGSAWASSGWLQAVAVPVGLVNGVLAAWLLGTVAIAFLSDRMADVFSRVRYGQIFRSGDPVGVLEQIEQVTLKGEQQMHAKRRDERAARLRSTRGDDALAPHDTASG